MKTIEQYILNIIKYILFCQNFHTLKNIEKLLLKKCYKLISRGVEIYFFRIYFFRR